MNLKKYGLKNIIIVSVVILIAVFAGIFIISRHSEDQKHYKGVFVFDELCKPNEYGFLNDIYV